MKLTRRQVMVGGAVAGLGASISGAPFARAQQAYPNRTVTMIVPWPAGGITDVTGRIIGQGLSEVLGQPVVIDNRPGAAGTVGHAAAARMPADGYTILLGTNSSYAMAPHLLDSIDFDTEKDFIGLGHLTRSAQLFCCHPSLPVDSFEEFLAYVRERQPDGVSFQSSGNGSSSHLAAELLMAMGDFKMKHVSYRGGAPALQAMVNGEIECGFVEVVIGLPQIEAELIVVLAASTPQRAVALPDVPTIDEAGIPGFASSTDVSMFVPAGTPDDVVAVLTEALGKTMTSQTVLDALKQQGAQIIAGKPEEFPAYFREEYAKWGELISERGIKVE